MLTIIPKGTGRRRAASSTTSDMPVGIGVVALGVLSLLMAFGFGTHPDSSESTRAMFLGVFTLLGVVLVLGGLVWCYRLSRK